MAITGQVAHWEISTNYHQEVDLKERLDNVCGYRAIIHAADQMPRLIPLEAELRRAAEVINGGGNVTLSFSIEG